jgi:hypothetical protein
MPLFALLLRAFEDHLTLDSGQQDPKLPGRPSPAAAPDAMMGA